MDKYSFQEEIIMVEKLGLDRKRTWKAVPFFKFWIEDWKVVASETQMHC